MTQSSTPMTPAGNWQQDRDEWTAEVGRMTDDVKRRAKSRDWAVRRDLKNVTEDGIGAYQLPILTLLTSRGRVVFDPVGRYVAGASGRVDLYAFPSFAQVALVRRNGDWRFLADADFSDLGRGWREEDFVRTIDELQAVG